MRALHLAVIGALLAIPSTGQAQDNGLVGGKVGPGLESSPALRGPNLGTRPYGTAPGAGPPAGYAGAVVPGQVVPQSAPVTQRWGGFGTAFVNGHRVLVDPNSGRILRVLN
jgi:hypothetical protein